MAPGQSFEELLIRTQVIAPAQLAVAQQEAQKHNRRVAATLLDLGFIGERRFAEWMSQMTSIAIVDPLPEAVVEPLVRRIPRAIAREYEVVPVKLEAGSLTIATINPLDEGCLDVLRATTAMTVRPLIALHSTLLELLARFYPEDRVEPTLMPAAFDPGATMAVPGADDSPGSTTHVFAPPAPPAETQLDRVERTIVELRKMVASLQERIDAIDQTLEHLLTRR